MEFGGPAALIERIGELMKQGSHPPGKMLHAPNTAQADFGVAVEEGGGTGAIAARQRVGEDTDIGDGEVHALGAGGRNDVGGVAGEKERAILHGFDNEAAHGRDATLKNGAFVEAEAGIGLEAELEFFPDAGIRPLREVFTGTALEVKAAKGRGAHAEEGEAAVVIDVNEFLGSGRCIGENAKPGERVVLFVDA